MKKQLLTLMNPLEARQKLTELMSGGFVQIQEVPRSADRAPSRTFYLWDIDYKKCYDVLLNNYHQTLANIHQIWSKKLLLFSDFFEFMRCFSSVIVRHFTPSIPYAIPPTAPPIIPPTISLYIRPSVPLSVSPITCIERSKQGVTFNRELFALIGGVFVFCSFALGNHWSLKNQIGSEKERQESISKEILAKLKEQKEVNEVNEAIEVVNEINEVNEDK
ncbi:unnamed protein product [Rhizophagus irregularis]|nr:unnamed protein product [Rhizophagus irregularis]